MTGGRCGRCGRAVAVRGRQRICSNCQSIANSARCAACGELRRVGGRDLEGQPWCERCRNRLLGQRADEVRRQLIVEVVTAADPTLGEDRVRQVLTDTVATCRSLRRLAVHLDEHPDVFEVGPTSVLPILDRFTRALIAAGAEGITTIHPVCDDCGRRRPRHTRSKDGGLCSACWARANKQTCSACGVSRRVAARDRDGRAVCDACMRQLRRRQRLDDLTEQIATVLAGTVGSLTGAEVTAVIEGVAPTVPARAGLVECLHDGPPLNVSARRAVVVARLLAALRAEGAAVPGAICADCDQPADPLTVHGGVVRCQACERRRDNCHRRGSDAEAEQVIVDAVTAADPSLADGLVRGVLADAVPSRRVLPRLAGYIVANPDVFAAGPTTTMAVVNRFTRALAAAGAQVIRPIEPVCDSCGQRRPRSIRTADGGLCSSCSRTGLCAVCGHLGRVGQRDRPEAAICRSCDHERQRASQLEELAERIAATVTRAQPSLAHLDIVAAIDQTAPNVAARVLLVEQLTAGPTLAIPAHRHPVVARLLAELRASGAHVPAASCAGCDGPAEPLFIHRGVVRCKPCATRCLDCGHPRARPAAGKCRWCSIGPPRPCCVECGRDPRGGLTDDGRCRQCRLRAERHCGRCEQTTGLTRHPDGWICQRCALETDLDERLGPFNRMPTTLAPVRAAIAAADNPAIVRKWLRTSTAGQLLERLAGGEVPLTHDTLDDTGDDRSIHRLRALLVASGALPDEDRRLEQLERFFDQYLNTRIADPADRKVVRAWLRWQVLPRLRQRADSGKSMAYSANNARGALHSVAELLDQLSGHDRNLQTATQADLDGWFAHPGANRWLARPFLVWTRQRHHLSRQIQLPPTPAKAPHPTVDDPGRWDIARQLVADDTLAIDDRVAAALVVLYGQPLTRIARLTTTDILPGPDGTVAVNVDGHPMPIHEPFATLIGKLPARRTNGVTDQIASGWLFPGGHAGKHVGPVALGRRLRAMGIEPRNMRNSARAQLVTEIPPAVLGQLIGISPSTASRWATLTSSNWIAYAANQATKGPRAQGG